DPHQHLRSKNHARPPRCWPRLKNRSRPGPAGPASGRFGFDRPTLGLTEPGLTEPGLLAPDVTAPFEMDAAPSIRVALGGSVSSGAGVPKGMVGSSNDDPDSLDIA
ncbi:MAG: hypothetical protein AAGI63_08620, partial [Planctomycetota bacterium]